MKCDICGATVEESEVAVAVEATPGILADDVRCCPSCFVAGVAEGHIHLNPEATEAAIDAIEDAEGEEWKS